MSRHHRFTTRLLAAAVALAAWSTVLAAPVAAQGTDDGGTGLEWAVEPSSATGPTGRVAFIHDVEPGEVVDDVLGISNLADEPQTFRVYGSDAFSTADGGFALLRGDQRSEEVGKWLEFGAKTYTVPPHSRLDLPFKIRVPANATPGDHAGGAVAAVLERGDDTTGQRVDIDRRVAARLYLRVAGPLEPELTVDRVRISYDNPRNAIAGAPMRVRYRIRNTGNTRVTGTATVSVSGIAGLGERSARPAGLPELLPGASVERSVRIAGVRPFVRLTAKVTVAPEPVGGAIGKVPVTVTRTQSVWAMPWLVIALLVIGVGTWRIRRRLRGRRTGTKTMTEGAADREPVTVGT
jgi:hypothetical protein